MSGEVDSVLTFDFLSTYLASSATIQAIAAYKPTRAFHTAIGSNFMEAFSPEISDFYVVAVVSGARVIVGWDPAHFSPLETNPSMLLAHGYVLTTADCFVSCGNRSP